MHLPGLAGRVEYAQFLHDASEVAARGRTTAGPRIDDRPGRAAPGTLTLQLPVRRPDVAIPVVELFLREA